MIVVAPAMRHPCMTFRPTPPAPKTAAVVPGWDLGGIDRRAHAGGHAAADEGCLRKRDVLVDGDGGHFTHDLVAPKAAHTHHLVDLPARLTKGRFLFRVLVVITERGPPELAHLAESALRTPGKDDVVSTLDIVHAGTCGLDDARSFTGRG